MAGYMYYGFEANYLVHVSSCQVSLRSSYISMSWAGFGDFWDRKFLSKD